MADIDTLLEALRGDEAARRRAVARAITLVESARPEHRARAEALLAALPPAASTTLRLGISGTPGVGKSTLIEALGLAYADGGRRVAVLAVDPSSQLSHGSILGDKTRMARLSVHRGAFIRPSPSGGTLGGVAAATRDAIAVVEAAGYDVVVVETVGVGQSEAAVASMTDCFLLLQAPNAGDDLQAMKRGVLELADIVAVNKADLDPAAAERAVGQIESALHLRARTTAARVLSTSAVEPARVEAVRQAIDGFVGEARQSGRFQARRGEQATAALWEALDAGLRQRLRASPAVQRLLPQAIDDAQAGRVPARAAAARVLDAFSAGAGAA